MKLPIQLLHNIMRGLIITGIVLLLLSMIFNSPACTKWALIDWLLAIIFGLIIV